ncbi:MAG: hypothetical protein GC159_03205 [Phycisphaera sp.]|nr:hypothetical protein [Phycisphaera sp.]
MILLVLGMGVFAPAASYADKPDKPGRPDSPGKSEEAHGKGKAKGRSKDKLDEKELKEWDREMRQNEQERNRELDQARREATKAGKPELYTAKAAEIDRRYDEKAAAINAKYNVDPDAPASGGAEPPAQPSDSPEKHPPDSPEKRAPDGPTSAPANAPTKHEDPKRQTAPTAPRFNGANFAGDWKTNVGVVTIRQHGDHATGSYSDGRTIEGTVNGSTLTGTWSGKNNNGGAFEATIEGNVLKGGFSTKDKKNNKWVGQRIEDFSGKWQSSAGPMEIEQVGDEVTGRYGEGLKSGFKGSVEGDLLHGKWKAGDKNGTFWFRKTGDTLEGKWAGGDEKPYKEWTAKR